MPPCRRHGMVAVDRLPSSTPASSSDSVASKGRSPEVPATLPCGHAIVNGAMEPYGVWGRRTAMVGLVAIVVSLLAAACGGSSSRPHPERSQGGVPVSPRSLPLIADLHTSYQDDRGLFFLTPGSTIEIANGRASDDNDHVLSVVKRGDTFTLFKAVAIGRALIRAGSSSQNCGSHCNVPKPLELVVSVVAPETYQAGVVVTESDRSWIVHLQSGQRVVVAIANRPGQAPWDRLVANDSMILTSVNSAAVSSDGVRGTFLAGSSGRAGIFAYAATGCTTQAGCPAPDELQFTFEVYGSSQP